jgi:AcrR family transcriptional regulator
MTIPKSIIEKWNGLSYKGDATKIAERAEVHYNTVYNAFKDGKCSPELFEVIAEFYAERADLINQYE